MAASVEATFRIVDAASRTIDKIKTKATQADAATKNLGGTLDKLGDSKTQTKIETTSNKVKEIGDQSKTTAATAKVSFDDFKRTIDSATRKVEGDAAKMKAALTAIEGKYTPQVEIEGVGQAMAVIRVLKSQLRSLEQQQARAAVGGLLGAGGAAATTAADQGGGIARWFGRAANMGAQLTARLFFMAAIVSGLLLPGIIAFSGALSALIGSMGVAALGAVTLGGALAGVGLVGLAGTLAVMIPTIKKLGEAKKAQEAYTQAVQQYGNESDQAAQARDKLNRAIDATGSPRETRRLFRTQQRVSTRWNRLTRAGRNDAIGAMADGLDFLEARLPRFARISNRSMAAVRDGFNEFLDKLGKRDNMRILDRLSETFAEVTPMLGRTFGNMATFFLRLADAARPEVFRLFSSLERWSEGLAGPETKTRGGPVRPQTGMPVRGETAMQGRVRGRVDQLKTWVNFFKEATKLAIAFFGAGAEQGQSLVERMTTQVRRWRRTIERDPEKLQKWFQSTIEDATTLADEFGRMAKSVADVADDIRSLIGPMATLRKTLSAVIPTDNSLFEALLLLGGGALLRRRIRTGGWGRRGGGGRGGGGRPGPMTKGPVPVPKGPTRGGGPLETLLRVGPSVAPRALSKVGGPLALGGLALDAVFLAEEFGIQVPGGGSTRRERSNFKRRGAEVKNAMEEQEKLQQRFLNRGEKDVKGHGDKQVKTTKEYSGAASRAQAHAWDDMERNMDKNNKAMRRSTHREFSAVVAELRQKLAGMGVKGADLARVMAGGTTGSGGPGRTGGGHPSTAAGAKGMRIPGVGNSDTVGLMGIAAPGELIVNKHTEVDHDRDARRAGLPTLDQRVRGERRRHSDPLRGGREYGAAYGGRFAKGGRVHNVADLIRLGRWMRSQGYTVGENALLGDNPLPGVHSAGGYHYKFGNSGAIDVNADTMPGGEMAALDRLNSILTGRGWHTLWRVADHFDHLHVDLAGGSGALGGLPNGMVAPRMRRRRGYQGPGTARQEMSQRAIDNLRRAAQRKLNRNAGVGDLSGFAGGGSAAANRTLGRRMARAFGWTGGEWSALNTLWTGESGWINQMNQAGSGATGIPQALPGSKMASEGADWRTNPATQIAWGLKYIRNTYGTPSNALAQWRARSPHWYAQGGRVGADGMPDWGGSFAAGGRIHARRPTLIQIGESGDETATVNRGRSVDGRRRGGGPSVQVTIEKIVYNGEGDIEKVVSKELKKVADKLDGGEDATDLMD